MQVIEWSEFLDGQLIKEYIAMRNKIICDSCDRGWLANRGFR